MWGGEAHMPESHGLNHPGERHAGIEPECGTGWTKDGGGVGNHAY